MNTRKMKNAVEAALGRDDLTVEEGASPVAGSPNGTVLIYLTDAGAEGPHVLVTDADDLGEVPRSEGPRFFVGAYFEDGEQMDEPRSCPTYTAAALTSASLVGELAGVG